MNGFERMKFEIMIDKFVENQENREKVARLLANEYSMYMLALTDAGFTREEAIELIKAGMLSSVISE